MPAIQRTFQCALPHAPKPLHLRRLSTTTQASSPSQFRRSDFSGQGFTASYEPGAATVGPLAQASKHGAPRLTPSLLKQHLDKYVVGQAQAKKVTSVAIYNHYQRIRELRRLEAEEVKRREKDARQALSERERSSHPVDNEFPGHVETVDLNPPPVPDETELGSRPLEDNDATIIEKSNLLLLGPSGVGKTYILQTLSRILEVPFTTVDCSSLTQAGYIGSDIETSIERLLLASNHSTQKCETGIIFFDEVDKLAKPANMTHGRDVSGEGVQQGLLKMIEGTTVTVSAKVDRNSKNEGGRGERLDRGGREGGVGARSEQYSIDTSNILFVFAGAFVGLEKIINARLQAGTCLGFGATLRGSPSSNSPSYLGSSSQTVGTNTLDYVTAHDLQTYGLIPELLGRIPIITSLSPLSLPQLVSILTEPRNSLVKQYTTLFNTYGIQLKFTTLALRAVAERALDGGAGVPAPNKNSTRAKPAEMTGGGIGARGLRSIMESVLGEIMFWGPGSGIRFCLIDEQFVRGYGERRDTTEPSMRNSGSDDGESAMPRCWSRGQGRLFEEAWEKEEEVWRAREEARARRERGEHESGEEIGSLERYREVGSSGM